MALPEPAVTLALLLLLLASAALTDAAAATRWYRAETELTVEQSGPWPGFARLPAEARESVRPEVWAQSTTSAGVVVLFEQHGRSCTDASVGTADGRSRHACQRPEPDAAAVCALPSAV
jgi:hypothetical protein